ncbi:extracellular solute-binding protein [Cysteiniphilum litorale]|uniref:extracellular solute-binding protein n=1 Tax=Cysteiniphilum litorale TaxID=2056700 RepID=UPI003F883C8C
MLKRFINMAAISVSLFAFTTVYAKEEVNVYSYRQPFLIKPILDQFSQMHNIKVNIIFADKGLEERIAREGKYSPADVILAVDISRVMEFVSRDLVQPVSSRDLTENIPANLQDAKGKWFALTTRARSIYAQKGLPDVDTLNYEDLAKPEFKGKICMRSAKHPYNIALIASMIANNGYDQTKEWLIKVKENLARKPQGNDRAQVKAIKDNLCQYSLGNSYYYGKMLLDEQQKSWAEAVSIVFPNQNNHGTHVNVSAMMMAKYAPNRDNALKLMEYLASDEAQSMYATLNMEYPVNPSVNPSSLVASWGEFKTDSVDLAKIADNRKLALKLVDETRFDLAS